MQKKNIESPSSTLKSDISTSELSSVPSSNFAEAVGQESPKSKLSRQINTGILEVSTKWNESEKALGVQAQELANYENQLNDPQVPQDVKNILIPEYNSLLENSKKAQEEFNTVRSSAIKLQQAKATLGKIDQVQKTLEAKETSMSSDLYSSLKRGSASLGAMIARTPGFIYDVAAIPQNALAEYAPETFGKLNVSHQSFAESVGLPDNKVAEFYESAVKESQEKIALKYDKGVSEYFANGEIENGFKLLANQVAESVPVSLSLMVGGAAGLDSKAITFGGGAAFGAGKKQELDETNKDMDESTKTLNAISTGLMEGVFEQYGITKLGGVIKNIFEKEGVDIATEVAKKGFMEVYAPVLKKYAGTAGEEISGEMATQFTQNAIDKYSGAKPELNLMDGVIDAGLVGLGASTTFSAPVSVLDLAKSGRTKAKDIYKQAVKIKEDPREGQVVTDMLNDGIKEGSITQEEGEALKTNIDNVVKFDGLIPPTITNTEKRIEAVELISERENLTQDNEKLQSEIKSYDKTMVVPQQELIAKNEEQISKINSDLQEIAKEAEPVKEIPEIKAEETPEAVAKNKRLQSAVDAFKVKKAKDEELRLAEIKKANEAFNYSEGKTSEEISKEQGIEFSNPDEADRHIVENSENPLEIAGRYLSIDNESQKDKKSYTDQLLDEANIKLTEDEFAAIYDKNSLTKTIGKKFINEAPDVHFDKKLQEIKEEFGIEISHDELADYIRRSDIESDISQETPIKTKFRNRFKELTGMELTPSKAKQVIESETKKYVKDYEKFIEKEYGTYAEAEQGYYDAIKSGEIIIEGGEDVSIDSSIKKSEIGNSEVAKAKQNLANKAKAFQNKARGSMSSGGLQALPEFIELVAAYVELGNATVRGFIEFYRKNIPDIKLTDRELTEAYNALNPHVQENTGKKPEMSVDQRIKSLSNELSTALNIPKELQEKIKDKGLKADIFSHEEAKTIVEQIVESIGGTDTEWGIMKLIELADSKLVGSVKALAYGKAIDYYSERIKKAKTAEEIELYTELGSEVAGKFESNAEDYGRFISAIGFYYKNHPDIIARRVLKKLLTHAETTIENKTATKTKIEQVFKELQDLKDTFDEKVEAGVNEEFNKIGEKLFGKDALKKVDDAADDIIAQIKSGVFASLIPPPILIGAVNATRLAIKGGMGLANAVNFGIQHIKDRYTGKFDEKELREKLTKSFSTKIPAQTTVKQKAPQTPKVKKVKSLQDQQLAILNKHFPKKRTQTDIKHKTEHEKIIEQYNAGLFDGKLNKDGITFESLFYEKLGIVNPNAYEIKLKMKEFAEKIGKAPQGSIMWREANQDMLDFLANNAYESRLRSGATKVDAMWYANILSSPATHLRNMQFNIIQTFITQPALLIEKAALKGDFKAASTIYANLFAGLSKGRTEASRAFITGRGTRFDSVIESPITVRGNKFIKFFGVPGKGLRAGDILLTVPNYQMKLGEVARNIVKMNHPDWDNTKVNATVNEMIGNTKERKETAKIQAEKELEEFYGPDWKKEKDIDRIQKIREFELIEESMPEGLKAEQESSKKWARVTLLTQKPTGLFGVLADGVQFFHNKLWFTKFIMPFVNVPLNVAKGMIERSPAGMVKAAIGREFPFGVKDKLTTDQRKELLLKSINYSIMMGVLGMLNGDDEDDDFVVTGNQTGNYTDNKGIVRGGKLEPYSVYIGGKKILNYKTTPWSAVFVPVGYMRDYKVYGKDNSKSEAFIGSALNYLMFINETSALQGVSGMFEAVSKMKEKNFSDNLAATFGKLTNGMVPYSGAIKYVSNTINAATEQTDKRPIDFYENIYRDIPFASATMEDRTDHFGQPVAEVFDVPLIPIGDRGLIMEVSQKSPYYKLTADHKYMPKYSGDRTFFVSGEEITMSKKELNKINVRRGQLVVESLDSKNVFVSKDESDSKESKMTTMEYMETLDNEKFKELMNKLFSVSEKQARLEKYGTELGITKEDVVKHSKLLKQKKSIFTQKDPAIDKVKANTKQIEKFKKEKGVGEIPIESY